MIHRSGRWSLLAVVLLAGCTGKEDVPPAGSIESGGDGAVTYDAEWNDRNADIYRFLLSRLEEPEPGLIYFITTTPMDDWEATGGWTTIPAAELRAYPGAAKYRPANEAYLRDDVVLEKGTNRQGWMKWISVRRWISATVVEVEEGVWCCPLGGGGTVVIYQKVRGQWRVRERGESWIS